MPNMGYCRMENTLSDLRDCEEHMRDKLDGTEHRARKEIIETCRNILNDVGEQDMDDYEGEEDDDDDE